MEIPHSVQLKIRNDSELYHILKAAKPDDIIEESVLLKLKEPETPSDQTPNSDWREEKKENIARQQAIDETNKQQLNTIEGLHYFYYDFLDIANLRSNKAQTVMDALQLDIVESGRYEDTREPSLRAPELRPSSGRS